jgi:hypothetical protein
MTSNPIAAPPSGSRTARGWSWAWLVLSLGVVALIRVPLVLNAEAHLDSDLAVDGLTLLDAVNGHWRWHYPATPFIGTPPVLLSWVQAKLWGSTPITLVSGGVVAYGLIVVATFLLNLRAFGASVASWGLIPLTFASTGTLWLSGRVTGGHLLAVAWHAGAFVLLWDALVKGGWRRSAMLGLWCGLGLYVDSMFALTWAGMGVAACVWGISSSLSPRERAGSSASLSPRERAGVRVMARPVGPESIDVEGNATTLTPGPSPGGRGEADGGSSTPRGNRLVRGFVCLLMFVLASGVGISPRFVGKWVDPHDAYGDQFQPVLSGDVQARNAQFLAMDCLPRLVAGHRLPRLVAGHRLTGLEAEPDPSRLPGGSPSPRSVGISWFSLSVAITALSLFAWAILALTFVTSPSGPARSAIRWGLLASSIAAVGGFLVAGNITNSDNYRYLVFLLVPWSSGFGLLMARMASRRPVGPWLAGAAAVGFASMMTIDSARWYARFGWIDEAGRPVRKVVDDPVRNWLDDHQGVTVIKGSYWDVYRLSFLTGGRVRGVPFGEYPQRFPEIKADPPASGRQVLIVRPDQFGPIYRARALAQGAREVRRGEGFSIVEWPEGMRP